MASNHRDFNDTDYPGWLLIVLRATREQPDLLAHLAVVSARAAAIGQLADVNMESMKILAVAGMIHDLGKIPRYSLGNTGFPPLDSAKLAKSKGAYRVAGLVATVSGAAYAAELYGLDFPWPNQPTLEGDALTLADLTTSSDGRVISMEEKRQQIEAEYGSQSVEAQALALAWKAAVRAAIKIDPKGLLIKVSTEKKNV